MILIDVVYDGTRDWTRKPRASGDDPATTSRPVLVVE